MTISEHRPAYVDEQPDTSNDWLGMFDVLAEITSLASRETVSLTDVLRLAGRRLCELLGASRCAVFLHRADGRFQGQVGHCTGRDIDAEVRRLIAGVEADGFTAEIVKTRSPVVVHDAANDPRTIRRTMRRWRVRDIVGVPLVVADRVIGIIFVDDQSRRRDFTQQDVMLAQAFAGLTALAVQQALLVRRNTAQARLAGLHDEVSRAVLDGADIAAILSLTTGFLGKPVVLYDPEMRSVAWAAPKDCEQRSPALTPVALRLPWVRKALASLGPDRSTIMLRAVPETRARRVLVRLTTDGHCAGYLELCEIGQGFRQGDSKGLEQAALSIALKLKADQHKDELRRRERDQYIADVVLGRRDPESLWLEGTRLGLELDSCRVVLLLRSGKRSTADAYNAQASQLLDAAIGPAGRTVASWDIPGACLVLVRLTGAASESALSTSLHQGFESLAAELDVQYAVVSDISPDLRDLPDRAEQVREVAELLETSNSPPRLCFAHEFAILCLLNRNGGLSDALRFAQDVLRPLEEHHSHNAELLHTLEAFVESRAQIRATAALLHVHENTVRYRLNRIRETTSIEPTRLDSLLNVVLALQIRRLLGNTGRFTDPWADRSRPGV